MVFSAAWFSGCCGFSFAIILELLIDSWQDQESIDIHHASPMMKTIFELREKYDLHMRVERYTSIEENKEDQKFLRQ